MPGHEIFARPEFVFIAVIIAEVLMIAEALRRKGRR
jgi:hypothetical protein